MLNNDEIVEFLWNNCKDEKGDLILSNLDLTKFRDVHFSFNKVKRELYQNHQIVGKGLQQNYQKVGSYLRQDRQVVGRTLHQNYQKVGETLHQDNQEVKEDLRQNEQKVDGVLYGHRLEDDEHWEKHGRFTIRKPLKQITLDELLTMGYVLRNAVRFDDEY